MPQHRRLTRPGAIHALGYWQDTDPGLEGPVAEGTAWFDTSDPNGDGDVIMRLREDDAWIVGPGGGTVRSFAVRMGNGVLALVAGHQMTVELPGSGRFVRWRLIDYDDATPSLEMDLLVADTGEPTASIVGATPPAIVASQDEGALVDPDDWAAAWVAGSLLTIAVASSASCRSATLQLFYVRS